MWYLKILLITWWMSGFRFLYLYYIQMENFWQFMTRSSQVKKMQNTSFDLNIFLVNSIRAQWSVNLYGFESNKIYTKYSLLYHLERFLPVNSNENWILHPTFGPILNQHYIRRLYNLLVQYCNKQTSKDKAIYQHVILLQVDIFLNNFRKWNLCR